MGNAAEMLDTIRFRLYDKWLRNFREGKTIESFFRDNYYWNVAIYGMGLIGMQVFDELKDSGIQVCYGIDKNTKDRFVEGLDIITPDCLRKRSQEADVIVITPVQYFYEIEKMLLGLTKDTEIVSIEQIVEYVSRHG